MFFNVIRSEWIKLRTTKSFWWTTFVFLVLSIGFAALTGVAAVGTDLATTLLLASSTVSGVWPVGFLVITVQAVMIYTTEFRFGYQQQTFLATPHRWIVAVAKWLLYVVLAMIITFITVILCFYAAKATASDVASSTLDVWNDEQARQIMWKFPLAAALVVTFSSGVALLLRQTAGAVALLLIWQLAMEDLLAFLPKIGDWISKYGPFTNLRGFLSGYQATDPGWSADWGIVYFSVWAVVVFIAGIFVLHKRDA